MEVHPLLIQVISCVNHDEVWAAALSALRVMPSRLLLIEGLVVPRLEVLLALTTTLRKNSKKVRLQVFCQND